MDTIARSRRPILHGAVRDQRPTPLAPAITRPIFIVDAKFRREHDDAYAAEHPVGTGAYVLTSWRRDDALEMDANPTTGAVRRRSAHVVLRPIPEPATRVSALRTGATDLITNVPFQFATLLAGGTTTRMASAKQRARALHHVQHAAARPAAERARAAGAQLRARRTGDRESRARRSGVRARRTDSGELLRLRPDDRAYEHDVAKAKTLLAKAGYPDGKGLTLTLYAPQARYNGDKEVALAVAGQLQAPASSRRQTEEWVQLLPARAGARVRRCSCWAGATSPTTPTTRSARP